MVQGHSTRTRRTDFLHNGAEFLQICKETEITSRETFNEEFQQLINVIPVPPVDNDERMATYRKAVEWMQKLYDKRERWAARWTWAHHSAGKVAAVTRDGRDCGLGKLPWREGAVGRAAAVTDAGTWAHHRAGKVAVVTRDGRDCGLGKLPWREGAVGRAAAVTDEGAAPPEGKCCR